MLILGGDITGKMIIPIIEQHDSTYRCQFSDSKYELKTKEQLEKMEKDIRMSGQYPYLTNQTEIEELSNNNDKMNKLFLNLVLRTLERWMKLAEERLGDTNINCYITGGNDDWPEIDSVLKNSDKIINPEGLVVDIDGHHEMISCGYSNITPWKCPRDIPEEELADKINAMASKVQNMENCIFNLHCPPYSTGIDTAPELDDQFKQVIRSGQPMMIPVGSIAVRKAIEKYNPLLGLHGHIHESRGYFELGRTLCLNPGSEYSQGILRGVIVDIDEKKIKDYLLTSG
jgi:Icc-related predicted phosphoesterase